MEKELQTGSYEAGSSNHFSQKVNKPLHLLLDVT